MSKHNCPVSFKYTSVILLPVFSLTHARHHGALIISPSRRAFTVHAPAYPTFSAKSPPQSGRVTGKERPCLLTGCATDALVGWKPDCADDTPPADVGTVLRSQRPHRICRVIFGWGTKSRC